MKILALDPATKCGFAHSSGPSGTFDLSIRKDESGGMRLIRFRAKLDEVKATAGVDLVVFEASRNSKFGNAIRVAAQLQGVIEMWCTDNGVEYRGYSPAEIKKHATGKGNAGKEQMLEAASNRGWNPETEDECDALWVLDLARRDLGIGSGVAA